MSHIVPLLRLIYLGCRTGVDILEELAGERLGGSEAANGNDATRTGEESL